jgi:hypothetical protein
MMNARIVSDRVAVRLPAQARIGGKDLQTCR